MTNRTTYRVLAAATALLALGAGAGCSSGDAAGADPQRVDVVAAFYPSSSWPSGSAATRSG